MLATAHMACGLLFDMYAGKLGREQEAKPA